ncbi:MAG: family 43 glycosylhydrolase [Lachnospiraceae bacterium]|nr:family 43 glycosylhydrolase [Lachnospiraceae bacterium]
MLITNLDYPDPDVIFADGAFYMISTTMHFFPGGEILRSYDLVNWEHCSYVFDRLDSTDAQRLKDGAYIYGKGMWAASLRYHDGMFYVVFVCNDTHKTYLYKSGSITGPWEKSEIEGFYHDCSLLFDEGRVFLVYGNTDIYITELDESLAGPKEGGLHRLLVSDNGNPNLGYEGSHIYKIFGRYYLFLIHSKREEWRRVEACFSADSLEGEFTGGDVFDDDLGFRNSGIAQGGIVECPEGVWHSVMFRDNGASGRIPVLVPVSWEKNTEGKPYPVFGEGGKAALNFRPEDLKPGYKYAPLTGSDDFDYDISEMREEDKERFGCFGFKSFWQFNHEPDLELAGTDKESENLWIKTDKTVENIFHAANTLTQRMTFPTCSAEVTIDGSLMNDGDHAGLSAFQGDYLMVGICKENGKLYAEVSSYTNDSGDIWKLGEGPEKIIHKLELNGNTLRVRLTAVFNDETGDRDVAMAGIYDGDVLKMFPEEHHLRFRLDHFTGCRFGLYNFSKIFSGGMAFFSKYVRIP